MCMRRYMYVHHMHAGACECQKELESLEVELQVILSHLMWMQGNEPRSSTKVVSILKTWCNLPSPAFILLLKYCTDVN